MMNAVNNSTLFFSIFLLVTFSLNVTATGTNDDAATGCVGISTACINQGEYKTGKNKNIRRYHTDTKHNTVVSSVYGPQEFQRSYRGEAVESVTFTVNSSNKKYIARFYRENRYQIEAGYSLFTSAVITLNGDEILSANELHQGVDFVDKVVSLQSKNELLVEVRGNDFSAIVVEIFAVDKVAAAASVVSAPESKSTQPAYSFENGLPPIDILLINP